ncbi:MAG: NAD(P)/FAD-dependent oxidoreductase [Candidatus Cloacimonetes bacterium]|nr:NAD(P)/FAD-dependent oxidoreductase [Candidatus Cloacimonadota bacterium]
MIDRRNFIKGLALIGLSPTVFSEKKSSSVHLSLYEDEVKIAHQLRDHKLIANALKTTKSSIHTDVLIAGGGVGGLSCARLLEKHNRDFLVLDPANEVGGTSASMPFENKQLPSGAHYVMMANSYAKELCQFYHENNIIENYVDELAQYNSSLIINDDDTKERSYYNQKWSLEIGEYFHSPTLILKKFKEFCRFLSTLKGSDNKLWFSLPSGFSSKDPKALALFDLNFVDYLKQNEMWDSEVEYVVNYACMDDYGCLAHQVSAWVGLHYFACRNQNVTQYTLSSEKGNGFLVDALISKITATKLSTKSVLLHSIKEKDLHKSLIYKDNKFQFVYSKHLVFAGKSHALPYIFPQASIHQVKQAKSRQQVPWLITQLAFQLPKNYPLSYLCWDNVSKTADSVGYIASNYFQKSFQNPLVLTHFYPTMAKRNLNSRDLYKLSMDDLKILVLEDFEQISPELIPYLKSMRFKRSGHAMAICPPNYQLPSIQKQVKSSIVLANCDSYGLPLFEEAFQAGVDAFYAIT